MMECPVRVAHLVTDNTQFQRRAELAASRPSLRASFGITDDAPVVLFCGRLIDKKRPTALVKEFVEVRKHQACWLLLVGGGTLCAEIEEMIRRDRIPGVRIVGFLNQTELPAAYTAADVFVLPSDTHQTWWLVINEAMDFSLPVIVSDRVGCLVRSGWNGFTVSHVGTGELAEAMQVLAGNPELRKLFGARSRQLVEHYSVEACADGIAAARSPRAEAGERSPA